MNVLARSCLLCWALASSAPAADEVLELSHADSKRVAEAEPGTPVRVVGKYVELLGEELRIDDSDIKLLVRRPELLQQILRYRSHRDNLVLEGEIVQAQGQGAVEVKTISLAPSDAEIFREELVKARKGPPEEVARRLLDLARRVSLRWKEHEEPEVGELAREIAAEALRAEEAILPADDLEARLDSVREVYGFLQDRGVAMERLIEIDSRFPDHPAVRSCLLALNCRKYEGDWVTFEEFKRREGFTLENGRWVSPREADLLATIRAFRKTDPVQLILRRRTEREYNLLAERGLVELGMQPQEVHTALGFPDRVERRVAGQKQVDQWIYGKEFYYFYDGLLVKKPEKDTKEGAPAE